MAPKVKRAAEGKVTREPWSPGPAPAVVDNEIPETGIERFTWWGMEDRDMTREQIEALRIEAGAAGDQAQVATCDAALRGDHRAIAECERVVADAAAQADDD